mmetsp:Transcript_26154/g.84657  ORF Transcript_26154/g.84657 Transcript_26154/m.84657 type:complete len:136 (+) Transcript_26154:255-662(+)
MRPPRSNVCDLCGGQHRGALEHGSLESCFFRCSSLAEPRRLWLRLGRLVAADAGVAAWWDTAVLARAPSSAALVAALLAHRAGPRPRVPLAALRHNLTVAFLHAFLPWLHHHRVAIDLLCYGHAASPPSRPEPLL